MKNPAREFALNAEEKRGTIKCGFARGSAFDGCDMVISDDSNVNIDSVNLLETSYNNQTELDNHHVFIVSKKSKERRS
jgi:hypothetical protein